MLDETLTQLETTIRQSEALHAEKKAELLLLLTTLKAELATLQHTNTEHAVNLAMFIARSTQEAIRQTSKPPSADAATPGLTAPLEELEASHPQLIQTVNAISVLLSSIGI